MKPSQNGGFVERTEGSPPLRAKTRAAPLYSVGPVSGPDHEAIIRFGREAPRRQAFAGGDHAPEGDEQLAGECDDHLRLAGTVGALGSGPEPLGQSAILLKQEEPPSELNHATTHPGVARFREAFFARKTASRDALRQVPISN